jgi:hypothetical protein
MIADGGRRRWNELLGYVAPQAFVLRIYIICRFADIFGERTVVTEDDQRVRSKRVMYDDRFEYPRSARRRSFSCAF